MDKRKSGYIYVIKSGKQKRYKIGKSYDSFKRNKQLQTGSGNILNIICMFYFENIDITEKIIHEKFRKYRIHGEWFKFTDDVLKNCTNYIGLLFKIDEQKNNTDSSIDDSDNSEIIVDNDITKDYDDPEGYIVMENDNNNTKSNDYKYYCKKCNYTTNDKSNLNKHLKSIKHIKRKQKHIKLQNKKIKIYKNEGLICTCGKQFSYASGLSRHKKVCNGINLYTENAQLRTNIMLYKNKVNDLQQKLEIIQK